VRALGIAAGGIFLLAELANLYSQPQDPQMQIQPMIWLPISFGLFLHSYLQREHSRFPKGLLLLSLVPFCFNGTLFYQERGCDSAAAAELERLRVAADPSQTFFLNDGFDPMTSWSSVLWPPDRRHIIRIEKELLLRGKSGDEMAESISLEIEKAMSEGYRVVAGPFWNYSERQFAEHFSIISNREKSLTIHRMLKRKFTGRLFLITRWGSFYDLVSVESAQSKDNGEGQ
jgi:hypothetical protein